jgi:subtilisin family serine protease
MKSKFLLLSIFLFAHFTSISQQKYWIFFKNKEVNQTIFLSKSTLENRRNLGLSEWQFTDIPLNEKYISHLKKMGIQPLRQSKWLNAFSAYLNNFQIEQLKEMDFVEAVRPMNKPLAVCRTNLSKEDGLKFDLPMKQIGIEHFLQAGLSAKNVKIGVIDAGFYEAHETLLLKYLFENNQILDTKDWVNVNKKDFFGISETASDFHGTEVLSAIAGKNHEFQMGLATQASFYLARTDNGNREFRGEEDNWVAAMEWMDSLGVRLINTSLGYAKGFSNPKENYKPQEMNGSTSIISKAAQIAIQEKGMILVVSAGNEGDDKDWKIISTPADVEGTIAVGATNEKGLKMPYSSIGAEFNAYLKPNVACFSLFGTSLAAPVITGFVACLLEINPNLSPKEAKQILEESSTLFPFGNNYLGYGIPQAERALHRMNGDLLKNNTKIIEVEATAKEVEIRVEPESLINIFHKKNAFHVLSQESFRSKFSFFTLKRNAQEKQTTIFYDNQLIEVIWK